MAKKITSKKPAKSPSTKKVAKSNKPKAKTIFDTLPHDSKSIPLNYSSIDFNGHFKKQIDFTNENSKVSDSIDLFADDRPWFVKAWGKVIEAYRSATDYAWENPVKTFFIIVGAVFTMSVVSSCVQKYL